MLDLYSVYRLAMGERFKEMPTLMCKFYGLSCLPETAAIFIPNLLLMLFFDPYYKHQRHKFLIYMTNWNVLAVNARFFLQAWDHWHPGTSPVAVEWLYNVTNDLSLSTSVSFWVLLYWPNPEEYRDRWYFNHYEHTLTAVSAAVDVVVTALPVGFWAFTETLAIVAAYTCFTLAFELLGWTNLKGEKRIYSILSWREIPRESAVLTGSIAGSAVACHAVFYVLSALARLAIHA